MMGELNLYGVYVPMLLVQAVIAYIILQIIMRFTDRLVIAGWIGSPNVFYLCLYNILVGLVHTIYVSFAV